MQHLPEPSVAAPTEQTPLLIRKDEEGGEDYLDSSLSHAISVLIKSAAPLVLGFFLEGGLNIAAVGIAGQLGSEELAIVGRGVQLYGVTGCIVTTAACSAQITLSAPLFTSRTNAKTDVGVLAQRSFILANLVTLPFFVVWWYIEEIFLALGQPPVLAAGLKPFLRWLAMSIPGYALMEVCKTYLQAQAIFYPSTIVNSIVLPIHIALTYFLVHKTYLGVNGVAVTYIVSDWLIALGLLGFCCFTQAKQCWGGFSKKALSGWGTFMGLLVPSFFMYASEWYSFEIVSLLAGRIGASAEARILEEGDSVVVAAQAAVITCDMISVIMVVAVGSASLARLGNLIGVGAPGIKAARNCVRAIYIVSSMLGCLMAAVYFFGRFHLAAFFSTDPETKELIIEVCLAMATYQLADSLQLAGGSILRAIARQGFVAFINIFAFYGIGIPVGYVLAFKLELGLKGLWYGLSVGLGFAALIEALNYVFRVDWVKEMEYGEKRREEEAEWEREQERGMLEG